MFRATGYGTNLRRIVSCLPPSLRGLRIRSHTTEHSSTPLSTSEGHVPSNSAFTKHTSSFKSLLENSKFVEMVDPVGKIVEGEVIAVTAEHLYIDFGFKFHGVVDKPKASPEEYTKGTRVAVLVKDLEVTEHFLGSSRHTSMLEADIELKGKL